YGPIAPHGVHHPYPEQFGQRLDVLPLGVRLVHLGGHLTEMRVCGKHVCPEVVARGRILCEQVSPQVCPRLPGVVEPHREQVRAAEDVAVHDPLPVVQVLHAGDGVRTERTSEKGNRYETQQELSTESEAHVNPPRANWPDGNPEPTLMPCSVVQAASG